MVAPIQRPISTRALVLETLKSHGAPLHYDLVSAIAQTKRNATARMCQRLAKANQIVRVARGAYMIPGGHR